MFSTVYLCHFETTICKRPFPQPCPCVSVLQSHSTSFTAQRRSETVSPNTPQTLILKHRCTFRKWLLSLVSPHRVTRLMPAFRPAGSLTSAAPSWTAGGLGPPTWRRSGGRSWRWWTTVGWQSTCAASPPGLGRGGIHVHPSIPGFLICRYQEDFSFEITRQRSASSRHSPP